MKNLELIGTRQTQEVNDDLAYSYTKSYFLRGRRLQTVAFDRSRKVEDNSKQTTSFVAHVNAKMMEEGPTR